ncbi:thiol-activated cytolysin family protein [Flavitalea sp.]|nr:thiol-activated cytolysin family protein [Flavitalea sp.]
MSNNSIRAKYRAQKSTTIPTGGFEWYFADLKRNQISEDQSQEPKVLAKQVNGRDIVEVGIGLKSAGPAFQQNGASKIVANGDINKEIQPMKVDFCTGEDFDLYSTSLSIYPGQFVSINSLLTPGMSAFESPRRKAFDLGIDISTSTNQELNILKVTDLTRSPDPEITRTLLNRNHGAYFPAKVLGDITKLKSTIQLSASLSVRQGIFLPLEEFGIPADINAGLSGNVSTANLLGMKYFMYNYFQPMYTIKVLTHHNELFEHAGDHKLCTQGAYVESVAYGRRILVIIGSMESENKIHAALSAALGATVTGGEFAGIELGSKFSGETDISLRNTASVFHAAVYGGEAGFGNRIFSDIVKFKESLANYIESPSASRLSDKTTAVPLHYVLRRISDNALLSVRSVGSYDELISTNVAKYKVEVHWKGVKVTKVLEGFGDNKEDIWGSLKVRSANINGTNKILDINIVSIKKGDPISLRANQTDSDNIKVKVLDGLTKQQVSNTILNFEQRFFDWEPLHTPEYDENNSNQLKFDLSTESRDIQAMKSGDAISFTKEMKLTESGFANQTSKITLLTKIVVKKY